MKLIIVLPTLLTLAACERETEKCVTKTQAVRLLDEGHDLERQGKPQEARQKYKAVDLYSCDLPEPLAMEAFDRAVQIQRAVEVAYSQTQMVLAAHLARNKRLPDSLADVEGEIPPESRDAFRGFTYFRKSDTEYEIALGLVVDAKFDLSTRQR